VLLWHASVEWATRGESGVALQCRLPYSLRRKIPPPEGFWMKARPMSRWMAASVLAGMSLVPALAAFATAQTPGTIRSAQREEATLEELLASGLKVRTPAEKAFIAKVVKTVEEGKFSEALVKALFQRACSQHSRYPLPYFTALIQKIAKQRGVEL
jgi:hypothetical protein